MSLLIIGNTDVSAKIIAYELCDDEPIVLQTITMADGSISKILAPYTKTEIYVEFGALTQSEYASLSQSITSSSNVSYYSEKTGAMKSGLFYAEADAYRIKKKTAARNLLDDFALKLTKIGESA